MKDFIEIILFLSIIGLMSDFLEKRKLAKFGVKTLAQLKGKISTTFREDFNGVVTTKDIMTFAFTLADVTEVAIYEDSLVQVIFVKKKPSTFTSKQVINTITEFIQSSSVVYPRKYRIDVNGRQTRAKNLGNIRNIFEYAESMGLISNEVQQSREETMTRLKALTVLIVILAVLLISDKFTDDKTVDNEVASTEITEQGKSNEQNRNMIEEKENKIEARKIYVEPETAKYDPKSGKWIICSTEEKAANPKEIRIRPGAEKYFPELNAFVICESKSSATNNTESSSIVSNNNSPIIGSSKEQILSNFENWKRDYEYENKVDTNAVKFENDDLIVVVDFDSKGIAEGVSLLSNNLKGDDIITGENTYVNQNYKDLVKWATGGKKMKIEQSVTTKYPVDIWIGNVH